MDLMAQAYAGAFDTIIEKLTEAYNPFYIAYYHYMREHSGEFLVLLKPDNGTDFFCRFHSVFVPYKKRELKNWEKLIGVPPSIYPKAMEFFLNGLFSWVNNGMTPDEEIMGAYHLQRWVSYILMQKGTERDALYQRLIQIMAGKKLLMTSVK